MTIMGVIAYVVYHELYEMLEGYILYNLISLLVTAD